MSGLRWTGALMLGLGLPLAVRAAEASRLTADVTNLDFGQIDPLTAPGVVPSRINLFVSGGAAFEVSIATSPDPSAVGRLAPARFAWRIPGDRSRELTPMVPTPIASGPPPTSGPSRITFEVQPLVGWDTLPGRYVTELQFFLNGSIAAESVKMIFTVPVRVDLSLSTQPLDSPAINPVEPDSYPYQRRLAVVTSNAAWRLVAWIEGRPKKNNSARTLAASEFRIGSPPNPPVPLLAGVRTVIARGQPTLGGGRGVPIEVWLDVRAGEVAGKYQTRLRFSAELDSPDSLK